MCHRVAGAVAAAGAIVFVSQSPLLLSPTHRGCCYFCHHRVTIVAAAVIVASQSLQVYFVE